MIEFCQNIKSKFQKAFFLLFYKSSFSAFGLRSTLLFPFKVNGAKYIRIGKKVHINEQAWLLSQQIDEQDPKIEIGDYTYIGRNAHIVSVRDVKIGNSVLIADKVYISDNLHDYQDIKVPIKSQAVVFKKSVYIGDHSWLGENVCVIGASVGKHSVVGANSVVTSDIPDYSIAVGTPAKVIKQYNHQTNQWERV